MDVNAERLTPATLESCFLFNFYFYGFREFGHVIYSLSTHTVSASIRSSRCFLPFLNTLLLQNRHHRITRPAFGGRG
jgi:hypothetical protein